MARCNERGASSQSRVCTIHVHVLVCAIPHERFDYGGLAVAGSLEEWSATRVVFGIRVSPSSQECFHHKRESLLAG
jgi:hypothetical protein